MKQLLLCTVYVVSNQGWEQIEGKKVVTVLQNGDTTLNQCTRYYVSHFFSVIQDFLLDKAQIFR